MIRDLECIQRIVGPDLTAAILTSAFLLSRLDYEPTMLMRCHCEVRTDWFVFDIAANNFALQYEWAPITQILLSPDTYFDIIVNRTVASGVNASSKFGGTKRRRG